MFDAIVQWLGKKGAKIKKSERPTLIESVYGRTDVEWNWDAEILRRLGEIESGTAELIDRDELRRRMRARMSRA